MLFNGYTFYIVEIGSVPTTQHGRTHEGATCEEFSQLPQKEKDRYEVVRKCVVTGNTWRYSRDEVERIAQAFRNPRIR